MEQIIPLLKGFLIGAGVYVGIVLTLVIIVFVFIMRQMSAMNKRMNRF